MKRFNEAVGWGIFLFLAGVFLLLMNLDVLGPWGALAWAALYALAGLGFLVWFFTGTEHWWRAIPAFTLLGIGAELLLGWRRIDLLGWGPSLVLFGMALGFWAVLLVRKEHWWAVLPAGVLTTVAVIFGLWGRLEPTGRLAVLLVGVGLTFLLLYGIRYKQHDTRWAAIPAGALLLLGVVTLVTALPLPALVGEWWPIALVVGGLVLIIVGLTRRKPAETVPLKPAGFETLPPAPGAAVTTDLPSADAMPWQSPSTASSQPKPSKRAEPEPAAGEVDIYELIKNQPPPPDKPQS